MTECEVCQVILDEEGLKKELLIIKKTMIQPKSLEDGDLNEDFVLLCV